MTTEPITIVQTGGPCGGKSTVLSKIADRLENLGYRVYCAPEAATLLILAGADPRHMTPAEMLAFQSSVIQLQNALEIGIRKQAGLHSSLTGQRSVILLDRGIWDGAAYVKPDQWGSILQQNGVASIERDTRYDAVIHLVTAAIGAEHAYTLSNNKARRESLEEARGADHRTLQAWTGHPHLKIIGNETGFDEKVQKAIKEITNFLGEPEPIESERKFLVDVDLNTLRQSGLPQASSQVIQHYLHCETGELRVRRRGSGGQWAFTRTEKHEIPGRPEARRETEARISADEYWALLETHPKAPVIIKERTCIVYQNTYFELDHIERIGEDPLRVLEVETEETGKIIPPP
jgi:predicted ATPase/CYTH domain-containing protein